MGNIILWWFSKATNLVKTLINVYIVFIQKWNLRARKHFEMRPQVQHRGLGTLTASKCPQRQEKRCFDVQLSGKMITGWSASVRAPSLLQCLDWPLQPVAIDSREGRYSNVLSLKHVIISVAWLFIVLLIGFPSRREQFSGTGYGKRLYFGFDGPSHYKQVMLFILRMFIYW